jgi:uncharacterized protein YktA (UPF0223 family)
LSKLQANILPSIINKFKPGQLIPNSVLYEALNATPKAEFYDVSEKNFHYSQKVNWADYAQPDQLFSSEKEYILASLLQHDETVLNLQTIKDIFTIKSSNQEFKTHAGKLKFLQQIRQKLKDLDYNTKELQQVTSFLNNKERRLTVQVQPRKINSKFTMVLPSPCECGECKRLDNQNQSGIKTSIYNAQKFFKTIKPMLSFLQRCNLGDFARPTHYLR